MSVTCERPPERVLQAIRNVVGPEGWIYKPAEKKKYELEERNFYQDGRCEAVVRPKTTNEVADVVRLCAEEKIAIVPQGGNTGLVGGGVPKGGIVLSTERLNRIRATDAVNRTMTVEAGVILKNVQEAADQAEALFPLSLAAQDSCHIGGNIATNAGGIAVIRYGNVRELVLGLEVVLPDGQVWDGLRGLRKDNTGYDLKQLFIGSEGTLGVITAAVLKLFPKPHIRETALAAVGCVDNAMKLFDRIQAAAGNSLSAFEFMDQMAVALCIKRVPAIANPFAEWHPCYTLIELSSPRDKDPLRESLETMLNDALENGVIRTALIAQNDTQAAAMWGIRESIPEGQRIEGSSIKNDISVPLSKVADFIKQATREVEAVMPGIRVAAFGHLGDGNIHFNLMQPIGADGPSFLAEWDRFDSIVPDIADKLGGSFSAEHGVGRLKRAHMSRYKSDIEIDMMWKLKSDHRPEQYHESGQDDRAKNRPAADHLPSAPFLPDGRWYLLNKGCVQS